MWLFKKASIGQPKQALWETLDASQSFFTSPLFSMSVHSQHPHSFHSISPGLFVKSICHIEANPKPISAESTSLPPATMETQCQMGMEETSVQISSLWTFILARMHFVIHFNQTLLFLNEVISKEIFRSHRNPNFTTSLLLWPLIMFVPIRRVHVM